MRIILSMVLLLKQPWLNIKVTNSRTELVEQKMQKKLDECVLIDMC